MNYNQNKTLAPDASVRNLLGELLPVFREEGVNEICVNEPGIAFIKRGARWEKRDFPDLDFKRCMSLATAVATYVGDNISEAKPLLSATLPAGERIQVVVPRVTPQNTVSLTIRVPSYTEFSHAHYRENGMYDRLQGSVSGISDGDRELKRYLHDGKIEEFFKLAVVRRKNIAIVGDTGSGKTTYMKMLCQSIPWSDRIITIEDVPELFLPKHENKVHLLYSTKAPYMQGDVLVEPVTSADLVKSAMRMNPDRVLPAELRGAEAFDFVDLLTTGHAGSITSFHARSAGVAFERFALMCKKHPHANTYTHTELMRLLHMTIDVIAHVEQDGSNRYFTEIYFEPELKDAAYVSSHAFSVPTVAPTIKALTPA